MLAATRASFAGKAACIDLTGVTRVDDAGRYLLALIHETGARMVSTGVAMKDLLDSISRDWPAKRIEGPGWAADPVSPVATPLSRRGSGPRLTRFRVTRWRNR